MPIPKAAGPSPSVVFGSTWNSPHLFPIPHSPSVHGGAGPGFFVRINCLDVVNAELTISTTSTSTSTTHY